MRLDGCPDVELIAEVFILLSGLWLLNLFSLMVVVLLYNIEISILHISRIIVCFLFVVVIRKRVARGLRTVHMVRVGLAKLLVLHRLRHLRRLIAHRVELRTVDLISLEAARPLQRRSFDILLRVL